MEPSKPPAPAPVEPREPSHGLARSWSRIRPLAWPVLVGQLSVLAFGTVDTLLVARAGTTDLAALAVGGAAYITVFIGLMGVLMGLSPIVGQLYGAQKLPEVGRQVHQALWLALGLALLGSTLLAFPYPFLALSRATPEVAGKISGYLLALAFSLPASLLFTIYRGFNTAVSRPKAVMLIQVSALLIKVPLSAALVFGAPSLGLPAWGVTGCGVATLVAMWAQVLVAWVVLRHDPFYERFALWGRGLDRPQWSLLAQHLKLGVPLGLSIMVEVSGFSMMAIFIARLGATPAAGHQIAVNVVSLMFMLPLALGNATSTLVAQRVGAGDALDARTLGRHGLMIGCAWATLVGGLFFWLREPVLQVYTNNPLVIAAAMPLLAWVAVFHVADAAQIIAAMVLRAYKITVVSVVVYVAALWGVGLGGGYVLAFNVPGHVPDALQGAKGYWFASTAGLVVSAVLLTLILLWVLQQKASGDSATAAVRVMPPAS